MKQFSERWMQHIQLMNDSYLSYVAHMIQVLEAKEKIRLAEMNSKQVSHLLNEIKKMSKRVFLLKHTINSAFA